tara:strand:- start:94 stop:1098 length:1005 start_codon:yes stop_codon:yes gene_type:complete
MARYGISSRILTSKFLNDLLEFRCLSALIYLEEEAKKNNNFKEQNKLSRIQKNIFKKKLEYLNSLSKRERQEKISELIPTTYPSINKLPIRALINPTNSSIVNKKLQKFSYNKPILNLDSKLKKLGFPATFSGESFSIRQLDELRRGIVWLNWFYKDQNQNPLRPKKVVMSSSAMKEILLLKENEEIIKFLKNGAKKGKKIELEKLFKKIDLNNTSVPIFKTFLSSLNENTYKMMLLIKNKNKFKKDLRITYSKYEHLLLDMSAIEKNIFRNLPVFYLNSFDGHTSSYNEFFYKNGITRVWHLVLFKEEFEDFFSSLTKTREVLKTLKESFKDL